MPHGQLFYDQIRSGGAIVKTANYSLVKDDGWRAIIHNSASPHTFTLPNPPPSLLWKVYITNIGSGALTVSRNTLTIDGVAADITVPQFDGIVIFSDGSNYFTVGEPITSALLLQTNSVNNGSQAKLNLVAGTNITLVDNGTGNVTITGTGGGGSGVVPSNYQLYDGTNYYLWPPAFTCTLPLAANFSWLNQGGATETAIGGELQLVSGNVSTLNYRTQLIGAHTQAIGAFVSQLINGGAVGHNPVGGILFYESGTGKLMLFVYGYNNGPVQIGVWYLTAPTVFNSVISSTNAFPTYGESILPPLYRLFRLRIVSSTIFFEYSWDGGTNWHTLYSEAQNAHFTTKPDSWGYFVVGDATTIPSVNNLCSWAVA